MKKIQIIIPIIITLLVLIIIGIIFFINNNEYENTLAQNIENIRIIEPEESIDETPSDVISTPTE